MESLAVNRLRLRILRDSQLGAESGRREETLGETDLQGGRESGGATSLEVLH